MTENTPNIRFIHNITEKFCIAVQDIDNDFVAISAAFCADNDNYSRKTGRKICKHRASAISVDPTTRYAMIADRSSFKETSLIGIWVELHMRLQRLREQEIGWEKCTYEDIDSNGVLYTVTDYYRNDNSLLWETLSKELNAEVASTK